MAKRKPPHGSNWSIRARNFDGVNHVNFETGNGPVMDEIFIDDWFHLEQLTERDWYLYVGGVRLDVHLDKAGKASVMLNGEPVDEEVYRPDKRKPRDQRQDLLDRVKRLKAATERAQEQFGLAMIDQRPLSEVDWLRTKLQNIPESAVFTRESINSRITQIEAERRQPGNT